MPTYVLDADRSAIIAAGPLKVTASIRGGGVARLAVVGSGVTSVQPRADFVVISGLRDRAQVVIRSADGSPFPPNTTVSLDLTTSSPGGSDGDRAMLAPVRIGGLVTRELVSVQMEGRALRVTSISNTAEDLDLGSLGDAARAATATRLGTTVLPPGVASDVRIAVDGSASFRRRFEDGTLAAVLDLLAGVTAVVASSGRLETAVLAGEGPRWTIRGPAEVRAGLTADLAGRPLTSGAGSLAGLIGATTFFVTDGSEPVLPAAGLHLVVLEDDTVVRAGRRIEVPVTVVPPSRRSLTDDLLADAALLHRLVDSLIQHWVAVVVDPIERGAS